MIAHAIVGGFTLVTADKINLLIYRPQGNAQVNAILNTVNLAATNEQHCVAFEAFTKMVNKRYAAWVEEKRKTVKVEVLRPDLKGPRTVAALSP